MKKIVCIIFCVFWRLSLEAQITISGAVYDAETNEAIIGANITDSIGSNGTSTNTQAYYVLKTSSPEVKVSFLGYESQTIKLNQSKDSIINVYLKPLSYQLGEVTVRAERYKQANVSTLEIKEIMQIPSLTGQTDVVKSAEILPGIKTQSEASSLLIVRGGDPGQNQFLLDNSALIYVNHLGGFMSVFNPDIINDITIYKGGFPAKYGGKLSSIFDITQRTGNNKEFKGSFGIGLTDVNLSLEGKITDKMTYILTARKTVFDLYLLAVTTLDDVNEAMLAYGFYDVNFKSVWRIDGRNTLSLNLFSGDDYIAATLKPNKYDNTNARFANVWGNVMGSLSWNSIVTPKIFGKTTLSYTKYRVSDLQVVKNNNNTSDSKNRFVSNVRDLSLNSVWSFSLMKKWELVAGLHSSYQRDMPYGFASSINATNRGYTETILNTALSLSNKFSLGKFFDAEIGGRFGNYWLTDISQLFFEPRIDLIFDMKKAGHINLNYMHVTQPLHLLVTSGNIFSNEIWLPASKTTPVSLGKQFSVSWTKDFYNDMFSISVGGYHKDLSNLVATEKNIYYLDELENWKESIETGGKGRVDGLEFMLKKNYGKWTGLVSYHYSKSTRQFDNINNGNRYVYEYNRPHDFTIFINRKITDKLSISVVWNYQSGLPYTPAIGRQTLIDPNTYEYYEAFIYGERNSEQMKDYHRLDIGLSYEKLSKRRKLKTVWTFSIYNLYNRHNANYYYYNNNASGEIHNPQNGFAELNLYQMSIFPIFPSFSYKVYFGKSERVPKPQRDESYKKGKREKTRKWLEFDY